MVRKMFSLFMLLLIVTLAFSASISVEAQAATSTPSSLTLVEWDYYTSGDGATVWGDLLNQCADGYERHH